MDRLRRSRLTYQQRSEAVRSLLKVVVEKEAISQQEIFGKLAHALVGLEKNEVLLCDVLIQDAHRVLKSEELKKCLREKRIPFLQANEIWPTVREILDIACDRWGRDCIPDSVRAVAYAMAMRCWGDYLHSLPKEEWPRFLL